jgi:hypothetical protein
MQTADHKPRIGQRVIVIRQSGRRVIARWDRAHNAFWRAENSLQWLDDNNNFTDVAFDPVIAWLPLNAANKVQHCELCGNFLSLPHGKKCGRCVEFNNMFMTLMRSEQARAVLLGELLTPSMVAAIVDIDSAYGYGEANEYDVAQEEGWAQLATIATSVYKKKMSVQ